MVTRRSGRGPEPCTQRAGLAAGLEFIACPPGTAAE